MRRSGVVCGVVMLMNVAMTSYDIMNHSVHDHDVQLSSCGTNSSVVWCVWC